MKQSNKIRLILIAVILFWVPVLYGATTFFTTDDKNKLNNIEDGADVTDADNVNTAGALMHTDFTGTGVIQRTGVETYTVGGDIDPDTLSGDTVDNNLIDNGLVAVTDGSTYTNFGALADDTIDELVAAIDASWPTGSGSAIVLDLADDDSNESTDLKEVAISGDTNSIFTEPSADKLLINLSNNWPTADNADTLDSLDSTAFESATSDDIDPDRLNGDTVDDNLIDKAILPGPSGTSSASTSVNLTTAQLNQVYVADSTSAVTINLPDCGSSEQWYWITVIKKNTGTLTINAFSGGGVNGAEATGTSVANDTTETFASIKLRLIDTADGWVIENYPFGTWTVSS